VRPGTSAIRSGSHVLETLILMRHAESVFNARGVLNADPTTPGGLTERGRAQADAARQRLANTRIDLCVTTDFQRALETADIAVRGRGIRRLVMPVLNDPSNGKFELRPAHELEEWQRANGPDVPLPGTGRTLRSCFQDTHAAVDKLVMRTDGTVLAILHGLTVGWILRSSGFRSLPDQAQPAVLSVRRIQRFLADTEDDVLRFWSS
jgi:broad specificity phosphatase PhoE